MNPHVMVTDGGPHPAEKWAEVTAREIIQVGENASSENASAGRKLELRILDILEEHYKSLQSSERSSLATEGDDRLDKPLGGHALCDAVVDKIVAAAAGTPFEQHFGWKDVRDRIHTVLHQHADNALVVERGWHAHRHPDGPKARAFQKRHRDGITRRVKST